MMKLDPVIIEEPRKEIGTREPQSPFKIRGKSYDFAHIFIRTISSKAGHHWITDFSGKRPSEMRVSKSESEHLLGTHPSSRVGSASTALPLLDFFGAIRKFTERFTRMQWLNPQGFGSKGEQGVLDLEV